MKKIISIGIFLALIALPLKAADLGGQVVSIGSDTTYPPHEFIEDGKVVGFTDGLLDGISKSQSWS